MGLGWGLGWSGDGGWGGGLHLDMRLEGVIITPAAYRLHPRPEYVRNIHQIFTPVA